MCRYIASDKSLECVCPLVPKGELPGDTPGVTRYPHPESNNTLKSKAPASGVPARLRVFCLTTISPSLPNSASSSAPASPQGLAALYGRLAYVLKGYGSAGRAAQTRSRAGTPEPPSKAIDRLHSRPTRGHNQPASARRAFDRSSRASHFVDRRFSRARKSTIARNANLGPQSGRKSPARQRRDDIHTRPVLSHPTHRVHWRQEPLWLNRAPTERIAQATAQPGGDEREDLQIAGLSAPSRHMTVRPRSSGWPMNMHAHSPLIVGITDARTREVLALDDGTRRRHLHVVGQTGTGKSTLLAHMIGAGPGRRPRCGCHRSLGQSGAGGARPGAEPSGA